MTLPLLPVAPAIVLQLSPTPAPLLPLPPALTIILNRLQNSPGRYMLKLTPHIRQCQMTRVRVVTIHIQPKIRRIFIGLPLKKYLISMR